MPTPAPATTSRRPAARQAQPRNNALAQIHIAKAQLGLDDETYRAMLWGQARVKSAAQLDHAGRERVLAHMRACGFSARPPVAPTPGRPKNMQHPERGAMLGKIEALLLDADRPWAYAHAMGKQMFRVDDISFCHEGQLHKLVAALVIEQRKRGQGAGA